MIYILRGLPGSGKSTYADSIYNKTICSADDFHMVGGVYRFDPSKAALAHNECFKKYLLAVQNGSNLDNIVVDNTNTTLMELAPYVRVAEAFNRSYRIVQFECSLATSIARNIHSVPHATIVAMQRNLLIEPVPPYWKFEVR